MIQVFIVRIHCSDVNYYLRLEDLDYGYTDNPFRASHFARYEDAQRKLLELDPIPQQGYSIEKIFMRHNDANFYEEGFQQ